MKNMTLSNKLNLENLDDKQLSAVYALNMCTVSVSQIVDFNDIYLLEEQYDNILNNLNLKAMPDDEVFLNILSEMLNTITFFRIQDIKKEQIEKDYQRRLKNAVWSAVPNFNIFMSGGPVGLIASIATTVGTGYMNYRREKYSAANENEKAEMELEIAAIEQFDALKRELFTTAWKIASKYKFPDELRLTERQIHQYNDILLDHNEYKKYARLEAVQEYFMAYPPFWYSMANSAMYISETVDDPIVKEKYRALARTHYEKYFSLGQYSILREDKIYATAVLEFCDILLYARDDDNEGRIKELLVNGLPKAGNSFDILQLYALEFLKIRETNEAAKLLKLLVNEDYNKSVNAKMLSRLYVGSCIEEGVDCGAYENYQLLKETVPNVGLFPMPTVEILKEKDNQNRLCDEYLIQQKAIIKKEYLLALHYIYRKYSEEFNNVLPINKLLSERVEYSVDSMDGILDSDNELLARVGFRYKYIDIINDLIHLLDELPIFRNQNNRNSVIKLIESEFQKSRDELLEYQQKMNNNKLTKSDLKKLVNEYGFSYYVKKFFEKIRSDIGAEIDCVEDAFQLDLMEMQLLDFCQRHNFDIFLNGATDSEIEENDVCFLFYDVLEKTSHRTDIINTRKKLIKKSIEDFKNNIGDEEKILIKEDDLKQYLTKIESEKDDSLNSYLIAVLRSTDSEKDILFTPEGVIIARNNHLYPKRTYSLIKKKNDFLGGTYLDIGFGEKYKTKVLDIDLLYDLIQTIINIINSNR